MKARRVLLVDDDPLFRKALQHVLEKLGLSVIASETREAFLKSARAETFELFLIDLDLGDPGDGFSAIRELRGPIGSRAPIVVVSGNRDPRAIVHSLEVGADDYIRKPLDRELLVSKLSRYAELKAEDAPNPLQEPPGGKAPATVRIELELVRADEWGLELRSNHLLPKGTLLKLSGARLGGFELEGCLLMVTESWMGAGSSSPQFCVFAEFEPMSVGRESSLRQFLVATKT